MKTFLISNKMKISYELKLGEHIVQIISVEHKLIFEGKSSTRDNALIEAYLQVDDFLFRTKLEKNSKL